MEKNDCYKKWVLTSDFSEEEQYYYKRLQLRGYFKDIAELMKITQ